jgi:hypothetical protein
MRFIGLGAICLFTAIIKRTSFDRVARWYLSSGCTYKSGGSPQNPMTTDRRFCAPQNTCERESRHPLVSPINVMLIQITETA